MSTTEPAGLAWRTSSYSAGNGACVEVGWRTSSHSAGDGDCVEVSDTSATTHVRDTKDRLGGNLSITRAAWRTFLSDLRRG
ncbi:DUF397 domain-containing protein [Amycolatopsis sp. CA-230715]|uniref:DUF397 domain-containing protein n=1 Tax=Amycolatopsis sp. CA-230715 TaxID=2745196 RepID=UPI001C019AB0|nr:DUF397 domain-containing protein [Amycolatopsis sp. CA-230715]QWF82204.1 hypothetical protein HUW46_05641 [Amycolatopsis sp. CA-230715]